MLAVVVSLISAPIQTDTALEDVVPSGLEARDWITAGIVLVVFIIASRILRRVVEHAIRRSDTDGQIARFVGRLVGNVLVLIGVVYALNALEVQIGPLLGALGISGIAIAFALTAILENVFASVLLKTRRPIKIGDQITTNGQTGTLLDVNFRTVVLRNFDGETVTVPASMVANDVLVNNTEHGLRRTVLPLGVAYGTDLRAAQAIILDAIGTVDGVRDVPEPQAWVTTFGESSIDFDVRYWHDPDIATVFRVRSEAAMAIKEAFDAAHIEIPFPQRVVTMVSDDAASPTPGTDGPTPGTPGEID